MTLGNCFARWTAMTDAEGCVLAVEDDAAIRRLLGSALTRAGLRVDSARDGREAIEALEKNRYTVLLLDLMMPRMNGWEVIEWLETHPACRPRSVIVLSATKIDIIDSLTSRLVNAVVLKPFDLDVLTDYVSRCCSAQITEDRRVKRMVGARDSRSAGHAPQKRHIDAEHSEPD